MIIIWSVILASCTPEEITFPEEDANALTFTKSNAIVSLFNEISVGKTSIVNLCFEFHYPISFQTHSGLIININNETGLQELAENQTSGVYVDQVVFPISITSTEVIEIPDENVFNELLNTCGILPMNDFFILHYGDCFEFEYPFSLGDESGSQMDVTSLQELDDFYQSLPQIFTLNLEYPLEISTDTIIQNDFELYQILNVCKTCLLLSFEEVSEPVEGNTTHYFDADFDGIETLEYYEWQINGETVELEGTINDGDDRLSYTFTESGTYSVCIFTETQGCPEGTLFCKDIFVEVEEEPSCPDLAFTYAIDNGLYYFDADFDGIETLEYYEWQINGETVELEGTINQGDNRLIYTFTESGTYNVCISTETPDCPQGISFCEEVVVEIEEESSCPDLAFTYDIDNGVYYFDADFEGVENLIYYEWFINNESVELEGTNNQGDNRLIYTFTESGTYDVCISTETPDCPQGISFCDEIVVQ